MLIKSVAEMPDRWVLEGFLGEELSLAKASPAAGTSIQIGTLGHRTDVAVKGRKVDAMASVMALLNRPIFLLDVRRNGTGAQSSWSPEHLGSVIPAHGDLGARYAFEHLPQLAPSLELLDRDRKARRAGPGLPWRGFRGQYADEVRIGMADSLAIRIGRAFVEAATAVGGLAIFLCAEPFVADFDSLSQEEQDSVYCHRFTLVRGVARALKAAFPACSIERVDLSIEATPSAIQLH